MSRRRIHLYLSLFCECAVGLFWFLLQTGMSKNSDIALRSHLPLAGKLERMLLYVYNCTVVTTWKINIFLLTEHPENVVEENKLTEKSPEPSH